MIKKFFQIGFIVSFLFSCSPPTPPDVVLAGAIKSEFISLMKKQEDMTVYGTGSSMMYEIKSFFFAYNSPKALSLEEGRELAIRCIDQFTRLVNSKEEIRKYLVTYPFPPSGLEMTICFNPNKQSVCADTCISTIFIDNGEIFYLNYDKILRREVRLFSETYDEALKRTFESCLR